MKNNKKNKWIAVSVVLLLIPLAVIVYVISQNLKSGLGDGNVVECVLKFNDNEVTLNDETAIETLVEVIENADRVDGPANDISSYILIKVTLKKLNNTFNYDFYLTSSVSDCLIKDESGKYSRIPSEYAEKLFTINMIEETVIGYLKPPEVKIISGETEIVSGTVNGYWASKKADGTLEKNEVTKNSNELLMIPKADKISLDVGTKPDFCDIKVEDTLDGELIFSGKPEEFTGFSLSQDARLVITVKCEWYETKSALYYGSLEYTFNAMYDVPATVFLTTDRVICGGVAVIKILNSSSNDFAVNSQIVSERPEFITSENEKYAFINIPLDAKTGDYDIKILGKDIESDLRINVEYGSHPEIDIPQFSNSISDIVKEKLKEFKSTGTLRAKSGFNYPADREKISVSSNSVSKDKTDSMSLTEFDLPNSSAVRASSTGVCVFSGNIDGIGKTVIIDHGIGIFSIYANLQENSVSDKEVTLKDTEIGKAGRDFYFGIFIGQNEVNAEYIIESGCIK